MNHILTDAVQMELITGIKCEDGLVVLLWLSFGQWYKKEKDNGDSQEKKDIEK